MTKNKVQKNIPDEWQIKRLGEVCQSINSGKNKLMIDGNYPIFGSTGQIGFHDDFTHQGKTILVARVGANAGRLNLVKGKFSVTDNTLILDVIDSVNIDFLYAIMNKYDLRRLVFGSGQPLVTAGQLKKIKISFPPLSEQKRIVGVLEVWDGGIEVLERKIVVKENIKKGLMQQLLTGKKRLPGFKGKWAESRLLDIAEIKKGQGLSKNKLSPTAKYKCMLYGEIYTTYNEVSKNIVSRTDAKEGLRSQSGDVLLPASTTTSHLDLATATTVLENDVLLGGDINIIRDKKNFFNGIFLAYYLTHAKKHELARLAQGVTIIHLYGSHFQKLKINLPSLKEQKAIAEVLIAVEEEIEAVRKKLDLLKDQKKYLLNNLVTGTIRI